MTSFPLFSLSMWGVTFSFSKAKMLIYWISSIGPKPMDISMTLTSQSCQIPSSDVTILEGHTSEVC